MLLIREIMYCKPGKVRPLVETLVVMSKLGEQIGMHSVRIMTDFVAERYWSVVSEMEVAGHLALAATMQNGPGSIAGAARNSG